MGEPINAALAAIEHALIVKPAKEALRRRTGIRKNRLSTSVHTARETSQNVCSAKSALLVVKGTLNTPLQLMANTHPLNRESEAARKRWLDSMDTNWVKAVFAGGELVF